MHKIEWCAGDLKLADIATKNAGGDYLNPRIKYIMVRLENWLITLVKYGWQDTGYSVEQGFYMTRLDLF